MKNKKGFTLIELLAVIVILAIIALIVTPVVSNIVANARIAANARSVEGHIRNIELAIITKAFGEESTGDLDSFDTITSGTTIESSLSRPGNDNVTCTSYTIKHGTVLSASGCKDNENKWDKTYTYSNSEGAVVFEFKGTVLWPGLDSNGNPTQNKISNTMSLPMADSEGKSIVTYKGIVYMDPTDVKAVCNANSTITTTNTGCKKFYIYDDSGDSYKLIMDRNLGTNTEGIIKSDYVNYAISSENGLTVAEANLNWNSQKEAMYGPLTAINKLRDDYANGWVGNPRFITADEIAEITGAASLSTLQWNSLNEIGTNNLSDKSSWFYFDGEKNSNITSYSSTDGWQKQYANSTTKSNYAWLFDYTKNCINNGCNINQSNGPSGYYTNTTVTRSLSNIWIISEESKLKYVGITGMNYGIRPVLEIPKSLIG